MDFALYKVNFSLYSMTIFFLRIVNKLKLKYLFVILVRPWKHDDQI